MIMNKRENHRLLMTIEAGNRRIEGVRCKVYLPERVTNPVQLQFFLTEGQQSQGDISQGQGAIRGEIKDASGVVQTNIRAEKVHFRNKSSTHWGFEREHFMIGKPRE